MNGPLNAGELIANRYLIDGLVGQGGMQFVHCAQDLVVQRRVALKTPKNSSAERRFHRSAVVAAKVNHPNVAKTLDYLEVDGRLFLVEEFIDGADLQTALLQSTKYLDPYMAARIFHHLAKGLAAAHHAGVIHRDLKPTNVMINSGYNFTQLKITDFGIAKMAEEELQEAVEGGEQSLTTSQTAIGALPYMAPEAIVSSKSVGQAADIWSIGAMMYQILCGEYPFGAGLRAVPQIINAVLPVAPQHLSGNPQFAPLALSLMEIVVKCLNKDPAMRPTADELVQYCGSICYTTNNMRQGIVSTFEYNSYGYINSGSDRCFFHKSCVYGIVPSVGDEVLFSDHLGGGANRALPVVKLSRK